MNYQVIIRNNATEQPIIRRSYEKRITHENSITTIEDVLVTKIIKHQPDATLYFHELTSGEYVQHMMGFAQRYNAYRDIIKQIRK